MFEIVEKNQNQIRQKSDFCVLLHVFFYVCFSLYSFYLKNMVGAFYVLQCKPFES